MNSRLQSRCESLIFDRNTIYKDSYKFQPEFNCFKGLIKYPELPVRHPKPRVTKPPSLPYVETLTAYKTKNKIPFDLFWKPKEIIRTRPFDEQVAVTKITDEERDDSRRTRPRVVMIPAVSIDDIEDKSARAIIISDTYTSTWAKDAKAVSIDKSNTAPLPKFPAPANPFYLPPLQPHKVEMEWRMDSARMERKQLRSYLHPDKEFWSKVNVYKDCPSCMQTAKVAKLKKMSKIF